MKSKKTVAVVLLFMLVIAQLSFMRLSNAVFAETNNNSIILPEKILINEREELIIEPTVDIGSTNGMNITYEWYKNGVIISDQTEQNLSIENMSSDDFGEYELHITKAVDSIIPTTQPQLFTSNKCIVYSGYFGISMENTSTKNLQQLNPRDEFTVGVNISNLGAIGINAIEGTLKYNSNILEAPVIEKIDGNDWVIDNDSINNITDGSFKFVTDNGALVKEAGAVFTVKFKVKSELTEPTAGTITLEEATASGGYGDLVPLEASNTNIPIAVIMPNTITSTKYTIDDTTNMISRIAPRLVNSEDMPGTSVSKFKENLTVNNNQTIIVKDGDTTKADDELLTTGDTAVIGGVSYTIIVTGDMDGDGEITTTDLAKIKLHMINRQPLTGPYLKAANVDGEGNITINDLAQLKLALIKLFEIK